MSSEWPSKFIFWEIIRFNHVLFLFAFELRMKADFVIFIVVDWKWHVR